MIDSDIRNLVIEYVSRQQLVYEAILELRPDKLSTFDRSIPVDEIRLKVEQYKDVPGAGIWQRYGVWKYFMHSAGCRLTNLVTDEPLEWDAPYLDAFDGYWFIKWCAWLKRTNHRFAALLENKVDTLLDDLEQAKVIESHPISGGKLRLITQK